MAKIRGATPSDVPAIVALHASVAAEGRWIGTEAPVDTERFEQLFTQTIESDKSHLLVATTERGRPRRPSGCRGATVCWTVGV